MGKHEAMTPKAIAKKIKAKGLQKLRWYCQMCQKQCRDENGFKCHCMSESHQRQMQIFGQSSGRFISDFSRDFEKAFMDYMKRSYRHTRVLANVVYNELIKDRDHVHMNSTRWASLSGFCQYLGKTGKCKIEDTPKGWYLTYIDRDPETMLKQGLKRKRISAEAEGEERRLKALENQIQKAWQANNEENKPQLGLLQRDEEKGEKVAFTLSTKKNTGTEAGPSNLDADAEGSAEEDEEEEEGNEAAAAEEEALAIAGEEISNGETDATAAKTTAPEEPAAKTSTPATNISTKAATVSSSFTLNFAKPPSIPSRNPKAPSSAGAAATNTPKNAAKGKTAMEELMLEEERAREKKNRRDNWVCEAIVVKVMAKKLADGAYYKKKGVVRRLESKYVGEIEMLDSGHILKVDQEQLETVIPQVGGLVKLVNGAYRGCNARLLSVDMDKFCVSVQVEKGPYDGRVVPSVAYEDVCKLHT